MKAPFIIYADFECLLRKIQGCEPPKEESFTVKTGMRKACGFAYTIIRSDDETFRPVKYRGENAVLVGSIRQ